MDKRKTKKQKIYLPPSLGPAKNDPQGMYTGVPVYEDETPVQDADDL